MLSGRGRETSKGSISHPGQRSWWFRLGLWLTLGQCLGWNSQQWLHGEGGIVWINFLPVIVVSIAAFRPVSALALCIAFPIFGKKMFCFWIHVHFWDFVLDFHIPPEVNYHVDLNHYPSGFRYVHMPFHHLPAASWLAHPLVQLKWFFLATLSDSSWSGISNRWSSITFLPM